MTSPAEREEVLAMLDQILLELADLKRFPAIVPEFDHGRALVSVTCLRISVALRWEATPREAGWPHAGGTSRPAVERGPSGPN